MDSIAGNGVKGVIDISCSETTVPCNNVARIRGAITPLPVCLLSPRDHPSPWEKNEAQSGARILFCHNAISHNREIEGRSQTLQD